MLFHGRWKSKHWLSQFFYQYLGSLIRLYIWKYWPNNEHQLGISANMLIARIGKQEDKEIIFSELELSRMIKAGNLSIEDQIKFNILNFIHVIHLNKQDFIRESFRSDFFGELPMSFRKKTGQVVGLITVKTEDEDRVYVTHFSLVERGEKQ